MRILLLALLMIDSAMLAAGELMFQPLYLGAVPAPVGTLFVLLTMPWLVRSAALVAPTPGVAGSPVLIWLLVVGVLGLSGPGGDVMLPATWQSLLLVVAGLGVGLVTLRRVLNEEYARRAADIAVGSR